MDEKIDMDLKKALSENPVLPVLPLRNAVLFPDMIIPLAVGREKSLKAVEEATRGDGYLFVAAQKDSEIEEPSPEQIYVVGVIARILRLIRISPTNISLIVHGMSKATIVEIPSSDPFIKVKLSFFPAEEDETMETKALVRTILTQLEKMSGISSNIPPEMVQSLQRTKEAEKICDVIAFNLSFPIEEKQKILEEPSLNTRLRILTSIMVRDLQVMELGDKIQGEVMNKMNQAQKNYFLKEQLRAIQKELGEEDSQSKEIDELKERVVKAKMSKESEEQAFKEINHLSVMHPSAAEYSVIRTYLEWLIGLPWSVSTKDRLNIHKAKDILDEDHYGLDKVKDRILEYLAVQQIKKDQKGPIMCFVGPPGVGKTSLGKSIARALGRKFVRMSLGGIRDEAEIRGHRRTYVGALPGRIVQGIKKAGSNNPLMMLDEVDKLVSDFHGDPSSALLEVLDPEQNYSFSDHYLEVAFDLSKTMFIATGNILDTIPRPLLDRMEVLDLPGYTEEEKLQIAKRHLIPKVLKEHGLKPSQIIFENSGISSMISDYTREAGVRNLERSLASICRKVARKRVEGGKKRVSITDKNIHDFLGAETFFNETAERIDRPGVATGLAWTPTGGDILFIEATVMKGKGDLTLTGQLGDVMKESAQAALSYIRSQNKKFGISDDFFSRKSLHLHVPAGAIPKDGPSAGVSIIASMLSICTGRLVRDDIAMTGEITLRGKVLPVGGIKEKILAAKRAGISKIILPERNRKDLEDLPEHVRNSTNFYFVKDIDEAIKNALTPLKKPGHRGSRR